MHCQTHLKDFTGVLHADGYAGFKELYRGRLDNGDCKIVEAAGWAHVRRKFFDLTSSRSLSGVPPSSPLVSGPAPMAEEALGRIGELYDIEL